MGVGGISFKANIFFLPRDQHIRTHIQSYVCTCIHDTLFGLSSQAASVSFDELLIILLWPPQIPTHTQRRCHTKVVDFGFDFSVPFFLHAMFERFFTHPPTACHRVPKFHSLPSWPGPGNPGGLKLWCRNSTRKSTNKAIFCVAIVDVLMGF